MNQMLKLDPDNRLDMDAVMSHPWINQQSPSHSDVVGEFSARHKEIRSAAKEESKHSGVSGSSGQNSRKAYRSGADDEDGNVETW